MKISEFITSRYQREQKSRGDTFENKTNKEGISERENMENRRTVFVYPPQIPPVSDCNPPPRGFVATTIFSGSSPGKRKKVVII